jgi:uncharacterized protein YndB with AHSA1/START domain/DNA-binding transcriptional ArsR family regulator
MVDDSTAPAFRALADPSRRLLLDRLFERDGQTLGELTGHLPEMTRFGVMRHLDVLETAGLITTRKEGREKRHFLNPVPIRLIHDRWISKYSEPVLGAMSALKDHLEGHRMAVPPEGIDHVYSIFINASPERIWQAITSGDDTVQYYYGTRVSSDWKPGSALRYDYPDGTPAADGEVIAVDPPSRLEMTFRALWDDELAAEGHIRQLWELEPANGATKLTVTSFALPPKLAASYTGGMVWIVSSMKSHLEQGVAAVPAG